MAQLTKQDARNLVAQLIDDKGFKNWPVDLLDMLITGTLDELWGELLDQFPYLTSTEEQLTSTSTPVVGITAPGYVDLDPETVTLTRRFYRVQRVVRGGVNLRPANPNEVTVSNNVVIEAPDDTYLVQDSKLWVFPLDATTPIFLRYSYLGEPFTSLTVGTTDPDSPSDDPIMTVPWPDGYHMAYIYAAAARAMEKGDKEDSTRLQKRADMAMFRLKAYLRRQHLGTLTPETQDNPLDWGGV